MPGFQPHGHLPFTGSGNYSDVTTSQYDVVKTAIPLVLHAADEVPFEGTTPSRPFVICDFATADGGTSLPVMKQLIDLLKRKYGDGQSIHIIYEDQASNDFSSLFTRVYGSDSFMKDSSQVFVSVCGTQFYTQCLPTESLHLGFCSTAMHYLEKRPCVLTESLQQTLCSVPEERQCFSESAARDWEKLLLLRAKELVNGGQFVIVCSSIDNQGQYLGHIDGIKVSMFHQMTELWTSMVNEGTITQKEFVNTTFNTYYRNEEEFKAPLVNSDSPVYEAGLRLVSIETKVIPCYFHTAWMGSGKSKENVAEAKAYAKQLLPAIRFWSNCVFRAGLSGDRSDMEKDQILDAFYHRYEELMAANPQDHGMSAVHTHVHIAKIQRK